MMEGEWVSCQGVQGGKGVSLGGTKNSSHRSREKASGTQQASALSLGTRGFYHEGSESRGISCSSS